jgi:pilus assembly protein Flp/PilA
MVKAHGTNVMTNLITYFRSLVQDEQGQDLIEYALLAALIAIFSIAGLVDASGEVNAFWDGIATKIANAVP